MLHNDAAPIGGTLPSGAVLLRMPYLTTLWLGNTGIGGTLPLEYGMLTQLEDFRAGSNLIQGQLPKEWAALSNLRTLYLL